MYKYFPIIIFIILLFSLTGMGMAEPEAISPEKAKITLHEAFDIAIKEVPGKVIEIKLKNKDEKLIYEVKLLNEKNHKIEICIDAITGELQPYKEIVIDKPEKNMTEVLDIALKEVPGKVMEIKLRNKDEKVIYEIKLIDNNNCKVDIFIDASSGKIITVNGVPVVMEQKRQ